MRPSRSHTFHLFGSSARLQSAHGARPAGSFVDRWALSLLARQLPGARCEIRLWNGAAIACSREPALGTVTIRDRATLWRVLRHAELAFGEGYMNGSIDVSGDLTRLMESVNEAMSARSRPAVHAALRSRMSTLASARRQARHHYDLGNDFFRLWLDDAMVYTCAYFEEPTMDLEAAQQAKLEYVCQKLELRPGDRVVEAGCGWGALAIHMAKQHGAIVRAYNVSGEQFAYARDQAERQGVSDRVTFVDGDFRSIAGEYDVFVSIGMLEHVGAAEYAALGDVMDRTIDRRAGRGLLHFCGRNKPRAISPWTDRYIFPGGHVPALSEVATGVLEPWDFSVVDVENLRRHYAATIQHWRDRFERQAPRITQMFDDRFVRMWRLYLAAAEACFTSGDMQLFQIMFRRPNDNTGRWTRSDAHAHDPHKSDGRLAAPHPRHRDVVF
jgi:cyclopropane-fatty-acyl-phospholipid synthase